MKVLLRIDGLTNKVYAYKESWDMDKAADFKAKHKYIHEIQKYDAAVELDNLDVFAAAEEAVEDVFYENGQLVAKLKDPGEFFNIVNQLIGELGVLKNAERSAFITYTESRRALEAQVKLDAATKTRAEKEQEIDALKRERMQLLREKKLIEIERLAPQFDCATCLIIRDENEYLKEWLTWHIGQGVQHFFIYDHGSVEPVADFVQSLGLDISDKVTVTDWSGSHVNAQHEAYNDCLTRFGKETRWLGFIDSDEMVRIKDGKKLPEFLAEFTDCAGLFIPWVVYNANGQKDKSPLPCRERFTREAAKELWLDIGKVFVQPALTHYMMIHNIIPAEGFEVVDALKESFEEAAISKPGVSGERICVDHYYTKSHQEWVEKISRGACDPNYARRYDEFFHYNPDLAEYREKIIPLQEYEISKKYLTQIRQAKLDELMNADFEYYCSICLIIRDENEYLEDWLNWHSVHGVDHFYIYDHGSKQPVTEVIKSLGAKLQNKITIVDWGGSHVSAQVEAYNDCLQRFGKESRWLGFISVDEYVVLKNGKLLPELLEGFEEYAGLFIAWVMYGADGQLKKSELPLMRRFLTESLSKASAGLGKVFVQSVLMKDMVIHNGHPVEGFTVVDENKSPLQTAHLWKENTTTNTICINHYFTKSYEEWIEKLQRGSCNPHFSRQYNEFFEYNPGMKFCREKKYPVQRYEISEKGGA
ncbi:MAG: glycosyltransferase family 92 protein [Firmicutes bacterium]|nr:glycosyltransferase family 92 protein [Bacillota bacterium]